MNEEEENGGPDQIVEPETEIFTRDFLDRVQEAKTNNAGAFQSYWEADESDIQSWTNKELVNDPIKRFIYSAENGQLDEMKKIFQQFQEEGRKLCDLLAAKDSDGYTAMHRACYSNMIDVVKYLLELEESFPDEEVSQLEARTEMGWTPLHSAVYWNSFVCVEFLLKVALADPNARSNSGQTCLHLAAQQSTGRESLILLLTNPRTNFDIKNDQGETAYDIAKRSCKYNSLFEITEDSLNLL